MGSPSLSHVYTPHSGSYQRGLEANRNCPSPCVTLRESLGHPESIGADSRPARARELPLERAPQASATLVATSQRPTPCSRPSCPPLGGGELVLGCALPRGGPDLAAAEVSSS